MKKWQEMVLKLIEAGVNVDVGILEKECRASNIRFFTFHAKIDPLLS